MRKRMERERRSSEGSICSSIVCFRRRRCYIAFMACAGYVVAYSTRVNLSVAILYMTAAKNVTRNGTTFEEREFDWDEKTQGIILASFFYGYIVTQIPGGYLSGIIGGNHVLNIGVAGSGLVSFLGPLMVKFSIHTACTMRVVCGLLQGVTVPAMSQMWSKWAPPLERTILSTIAISGNFFSSLIVMPLCGLIGDYLGWEWMFYIFGIVSLLWSIIWVSTVFAAPEKDRFISVSERSYIEESLGSHSTGKPKHPWRKIFCSMPVGAIVVSQMGHNWGYYTFLLYGPKYYKETLDFSINVGTVFTGLTFTILGFLMQIFGQVSDVLRRRMYMSTVAVRKLFCCGGFLIQICFMMLLAFIYDRDSSVAFSILAIGLGGITWSAFNVNPLDIAAPHSAIISAIANTCATLPGIVSPIVTGCFIPANRHPVPQDWMWVWIVCVIAYLLSAIFYAIFARGEQQSWVFDPSDR